MRRFLLMALAARSKPATHSPRGSRSERSVGEVLRSSNGSRNNTAKA